MTRTFVFAYIDPGSGSLLLQALLGGAAGLAVAFKAFRARLLGRSAAPEREPVEPAER
jgi:hypothetical protein